MTSTEDPRRTNVELVRRAVDAFQRGDLEGVLADAREDFEIFLPRSLPNSGRFVGLDGYSTWLGQWLDAWDDFTVEIVEMQPVGRAARDRPPCASPAWARAAASRWRWRSPTCGTFATARLAALHLYPSRGEAMRWPSGASARR